jgi:hypothetical protein
MHSLPHFARPLLEGARCSLVLVPSVAVHAPLLRMPRMPLTATASALVPPPLRTRAAIIALTRGNSGNSNSSSNDGGLASAGDDKLPNVSLGLLPARDGNFE